MARFKHERLAEQFIGLIDRGELKAGQKLPSLRMMSKQQGVSLMTAYHAINSLQGLGYVESRPKSGYYVRKPKQKISFRRQQNLSEKKNPKSIDELVQLVYGTNRSNEYISFALNTPDVELLPATKLKQSILHVNRNRSHAALQYGPIQGIRELREQIAVLMANSGIEVDSDELLITVGCQEAINLAITACTRPGDKILIESPTYFGVFQAISSKGRIPVEVETDFEHGVVLESLFEAVEKHQPAACLLVTNFSNPLGASIPDEDKERLVRFLQQKQVTLIENDIYGELYFGAKRPRSCKSFDQDENVIYCSSFSKSLAPGYRIGWIESGRYFDQIFQAKIHQSVATSTLNQEILAHFLKNGRYDLHLKRLRKQLHTQSLRYQEQILKHFPKGAVLSRPKGGFVLWVQLPDEIDTVELLHLAMQQKLNFAPGQLFSLEKDLHNHLRISIGKPYDEKVEKGLQLLGRLLSSSSYSSDKE